MKTIAVRMYGKDDLRLEEFQLPAMKEDEIQIKIIADSLCMSSFKSIKQGTDHKRVPNDIAENPIVMGHELAAEVTAVGDKWKDQFKVGDKITIQPPLPDTHDAIGYTFPYIGGNMTYANVPNIYLEVGHVLPFQGDAFFQGSMAEPYSCVIGASHANYHTTPGKYTHEMEIKEGGNMALLAGAGPMGLALIDYTINREHRPSFFVVTDIDQDRLDRAAELLSPEQAKKNGVELVYLNTGEEDDPVAKLKELAGGGYDDVFVFAPVAPIIEQADAILGFDGCLNFFAGPTNPEFYAKLNFYNVHYSATHITGTSGGNIDDMTEMLALAGQGKIRPEILITHIGGLDAAGKATMELPDLPGAKKLIYSHISMPLTAIDDFAELGKENPLFAGLAEICKRHEGLWSAEAEAYLLENAPEITA